MQRLIFTARTEDHARCETMPEIKQEVASLINKMAEEVRYKLQEHNSSSRILRETILNASHYSSHQFLSYAIRAPTQG